MRYDAVRLRWHPGLAWVVLLTIIIGLTWVKDFENRRDHLEQQAWHRQLEVLALEGTAEASRLGSWLNSIASQPAARQKIEEVLDESAPLVSETSKTYEELTWVHPKYGIRLVMTFHGDRLVGHGTLYGSSQLQAVHPQPDQQSLTGIGERVRVALIKPLLVIWLLSLVISLKVRRYALFSAQVMLASALVIGAAWMANPFYSFTWKGIFSNDSLFYALIMLVLSIVVVESRLPGESPGIRFSVRLLLMLTAVLAVLLSLGPVGYVAICVLGLGGSLLLLLHQFRTGYRAEVFEVPS